MVLLLTDQGITRATSSSEETLEGMLDLTIDRALPDR